MSFFHISGLQPYRPASFKFLRKGYSLPNLRSDLAAGVTVGVVALPLSMAFAIASGTTPERGLFTAIVAGIIMALLGGCRFQIGGPTGAFVIIISDIIARQGYDGLVIASLIAGVALVLMGLLGMGKLLKFIPYPVTTGFTSGIGVLIFSSQIKDFFGLPVANMPSDFIGRLHACALALPSLSVQTLCLGLLTLLTMLAVRKYIPRVPAPFVGIVVATLGAWALGLDVETIGSRFGGIPASLPHLNTALDFNVDMRSLIPDAMTIAVLAGIESLLSAVVADGMSGERHDSSTELVGLGLANLGSVLFGGIPATGAIARTATNIRAGAYSPVSGVIHALTLVFFVVACAPLASLIPLASLAGVLMLVAWDMSEPYRFKRVLFAPLSDSLVMVTSFALTVFVDLTVAVEVGVVLAAMLFMRRMSEVTDIHLLDTGLPDEENYNAKTNRRKIVVYEITGPLFFGVVQRFLGVMKFTRENPEVLVLCMRQVPSIDATGVEGLETVMKNAEKRGIRVMLSGVTPAVQDVLNRIGTVDKIGKNNIFPDFSTAVAKTIAAH